MTTSRISSRNIIEFYQHYLDVKSISNMAGVSKDFNRTIQIIFNSSVYYIRCSEIQIGNNAHNHSPYIYHRYVRQMDVRRRLSNAEQLFERCAKKISDLLGWMFTTNRKERIYPLTNQEITQAYQTPYDTIISLDDLNFTIDPADVRLFKTDIDLHKYNKKRDVSDYFHDVYKEGQIEYTPLNMKVFLIGKPVVKTYEINDNKLDEIDDDNIADDDQTDEINSYLESSLVTKSYLIAPRNQLVPLSAHYFTLFGKRKEVTNIRQLLGDPNSVPVIYDKGL